MPHYFLTLLAALVSLTAAPGLADAQGVDSNPTGVDEMAPEMKAAHARAPGWLGVQLARAEGDEKGIEVERVLRASPAREAGLKKGDRLLRLDDKAITTVAAFQETVGDHKPGEQIELTLRRDGEEKKLDVELKKAPDTQTLLDREFDGKTAPDFSARLVDEEEKRDGERFDRDDLEGKPVVLDFWASWCVPCRPVNEKLTDIEEELGDEVHFVGLSSESRDDIEDYLKDHPAGFPIAATDDDVMEDFLIESYPTVFVLDADGRIAEVFVGAQAHRDIRRTLDDLLDE